MKFLSNLKLGLLLFVLLGASCSDDDTATEGDGHAAYGVLTRVANADLTAAFYLQSIESPDLTGTIDNQQAEEIISASGIGAVTHGGYFYANDYMLSKIDKWSLSADNVAKLEGSMNVSELGYQGNIYFKDDETAFVGGTSQSLIDIFNPKTMRKTGAIDFSAYSRLGEVTNYPSEGVAVNIEAVTEIIISGQYMYAALNYIYDFSAYTPATADCAVLVIDLNKVDVTSIGNTDAIVGIISDQRGSFAGSWNSGGGVYFMQKDENDDVYILCHNLWGNQRATFGKPACMLRIKSGATTFDESYYFDLEAVSKGTGNSVLNFEYYGNGKFLGSVLDPAAINPDDPYSYYADPIFQWWSFDLYNQTAKLVTAEYSKAALSAKCIFEDDKAYVPFETKEESYIIKVDLNDFSTTRAFTVNGSPVLLEF